MKLKETLRTIIREEIAKMLVENTEMNKISEIRDIVTRVSEGGNTSDIKALAKQIKSEASFPIGIKINTKPQGQWKGMQYIQITSSGKSLCGVALANKSAWKRGFEVSTRRNPVGEIPGERVNPNPPMKKFDVADWVIYFDYFTK
jgi:hypothetical protein